MKQTFIKKENNSRLILFFAGWGSDENLFGRESKDGYDYMVCFDYRNLDFDFSLIDGYEEIYVLSWSMGVWAANNVLSRHEAEGLGIIKTIAVNGTVTPIDDSRGIPADIFKGTLDNFSERTLAKFRRRICGNTENTKEFLSHSPYRSLDSLRDELASLWDMASSTKAEGEGLKWDFAIVCLSDKIFPPENQISAWTEYGKAVIMKTDAEHYSPELFNELLLELDNSKIFTE